MRKEHEDGVWEPLTQSDHTPCERFKHACVVYDGFIYIHGGRQDCSLGDFWKYNIACNEWEQLPCSRDGPETLEGHSMVAHKDVLYIFGGMIDSGSNEENTPLWLYDIDTGTWSESKAVEGKEARPTNRKGHSAVVYQDDMYIYGGYFDIKGAVEEFWVYSFGTEKWSALSPSTRGTGPGPRHGHSSVTYGSAMYLFGGLKLMAEQNDFWRFDLRRHNWSSIKTSSGPPKLVGHASVIHQNCLWIIGGGLPYRSPNSNLWRFHFHSRSWKKMSKGKDDGESAKMYHSAIGLPVQPLLGSSISHQALYHGTAYQEHKLSETHTGKPGSFRTRGTNKVGSIPNTEDIEMKSFKQFPSSPVFCSCSFNKIDQMDEQQLLPGCENVDESFPYIGGVEEDGEPSRRKVGQDVILIIGGKPFSKSCKISMCQMKLDQITI
ncbi:kelch domain-containing protein 1-like isoform 1-T2 [Discoglossus pictus]